MQEDNKEKLNSNDNKAGLVESLAKQQVDSLVAKMETKAKREKKKTKFYYSFLTLLLLFCLVQVGFSVILNISKVISYRSKIATLEKIKNRAETRNKDLKQDINRFSTSSSLEGIARNNLKMAGEGEVLILINNPQDEITEEEMIALKKKTKINNKNKKKKEKSSTVKKSTKKNHVSEKKEKIKVKKSAKNALKDGAND